MIRPIHPGLSPNVQMQDALLALARIFVPWSYRTGDETDQLMAWFEKKYGGKAYAYTSGRGALTATLLSMGIGKGDEVLIAGFTCVAVVDGVLASGAEPIFVDLQKDFTFSVSDVQKKTTKKTKAIILQHTFGLSSATKKILQFAKQKNFYLIEDMAHGIGVEENGKLLGTYGDAAIFSLGRDKAFSCVSGGVALVRAIPAMQRANMLYAKQSRASLWWVFQQLFHIVSFSFLILPFYDFLSLGKLFLVIFQKIGLLTKPIDTSELKHFSLYMQKLPQSLSSIALLQLSRLDKFNNHRKKISMYYQEALKNTCPDILQSTAPLLRYPLLVANPLSLKRFARKEGVYLGDWYSNLIDPKGTDLSIYHYKKEQLPGTVALASHIINLPTYPTLTKTDAEKVVTIIRRYYAAHSGNNQ